MKQQRLRILLSAYGCDPGTGSEGGVGWNWARQMARYHDIWVLTQTKYRSPITDALRKDPTPNIHFIFYELPRWTQLSKNARGENLYYYLWQVGAYLAARKVQTQVGFDLVHHVSLVRYWMPSFLALLPVPFIWGPVGGGDSAPRSMVKALTLGGRLLEFCRDLAVSVGDLDPGVRLTARKARIGLATTTRTKERMQRLGCRSVELCTESALPLADLEVLAQIPLRATGQAFRILSVGRLIHWKAYEISLRAFAALAQILTDTEYWLVGDGPEFHRLKSLATELGVEHRVRFWGNIPHSDVFDKLSACDVLVHPSLHDSGGWVCVEAMAAGRPVVCLDWAGPGVQVTEKTGVKVSPATPGAVIKGIADALHTLALNPDLRLRMGRAGRNRVLTDFEWGRKGAAMFALYESVLGPTINRPADSSPLSQAIVATSATLTE